MNDCVICGKPVTDHEPKYCCSGHDCTCMGEPIDPCTCSVECEAAVFDYIGFSFDERRKKAGIEKYNQRMQRTSR